MVLRLADVLSLQPREQNHLLEAAGLRSAFSQRSLEESEMAPYRHAIDSLLEGREPLPAAVVDRYGAVRKANSAFERISPGLVGLEPEELVDHLFGPGSWRDSIVNWPEVAGAWMARQELEVERTGDERLVALLARARNWIGVSNIRPGSGDSPMICSRMKLGDDVLELFTAVVRFDMARDVTLSELRIELIYPANKAADIFLGQAN